MNPVTLRSFLSLVRLLLASRRESSDWETKATAEWSLVSGRWGPTALATPVCSKPEALDLFTGPDVSSSGNVHVN